MVLLTQIKRNLFTLRDCRANRRRPTNRWTGATGSDFRIKREPAKLLGSAVARSTKLRTKWRAYLLWGLFWSVLLVPLVTTFVYISIHEGDNSRSYVPELKKIADQTSLYPGFRSSGEKVVLKRDMAYLFTYYQCDAQFADVQAFYARVLPHQGWSPPRRTNSIMFDMADDHYRREDYFIAVEQDDRQSNRFSIVFIWAPR
jgi:hypothetical protein